MCVYVRVCMYVCVCIETCQDDVLEMRQGCEYVYHFVYTYVTRVCLEAVHQGCDCVVYVCVYVRMCVCMCVCLEEMG